MAKIARSAWLPAVFLLAASPLYLLYRLVDRHAVDTLFMDDWQFVPLYERFHDGKLTFSELIAPHDEHRLFFPRIILIACQFLSGGDARVQCWVTFGVIALLSLCLLHLLRMHARAGALALLWFLANLTICSPIQWQNWLWPMQFIYFIPYLGVALCLCAFLAPWPVPLRFLACVGCAIFSSLTMAHGLGVWVAMLPLILWHRALSRGRERPAFLGAWLACAGIVGALYFTGIERNSAEAAYAYGHAGVPPSVSSIEAFRADPVGTIAKLARFIPAVVGGTLIRGYPLDNLFLARTAGLISVALLVAACAALLARRRLLRDGGPWIAFAVQGFLTVGLVAIGRIFRGETQALTARYTTMGAFCLLGILGLVAVALVPRTAPGAPPRAGAGDARPPETPGDIRRVVWPTHLALGLAGAYIALQAHAWLYGARMMDNWEQARLRGLVPLLLAPHVQNVYITWPGAPEAQILSHLRTLQRLGLWRHPKFPDAAIENFHHDQPLSEKRGAFRSLRPERGSPDPSAPRRWIAQGFATLPTLHRPPDAILFAYRHAPEDRWIIFDFFLPEPPGCQLDNRSYKDAEFTMNRTLHATDFSEWKAQVALEKIPPPPSAAAKIEISAWALNARKLRAYEIPGRRVYRPGDAGAPGSLPDVDVPAPSQP